MYEDLVEKFNDVTTSALADIIRAVEENVLCRVTCSLYFQDYNRECTYKNMTSKEVVEAQHKVIEDIHKEFKYDFDCDMYNIPFSSEEV